MFTSLLTLLSLCDNNISLLLFPNLQGYRIISVDIPRVWNHHEWIQAFEKFLDAIDVHHVSSFLYGTLLLNILLIDC